MGTPALACPALEALFASSHKVLAVVTGPDRPAGRGRRITPCQAKITAQSLSLPVYQPENLRDDDFIAQMAALKADLFVVIAFRILPKKLYNLPEKGSINIHASLLPKYRGAAPINHVLLNGETETGLTSFFLAKKVDQGDIIHQTKIPIDPDETFSELSARLASMSGPFLLETLELIEQPRFRPSVQDDRQATPAPKIKPEDAEIDWHNTRQKIHNHVRAYSLTPGAFTYLGNRKLKILRTKIDEEIDLPQLSPGELKVHKRNLHVGTADLPINLITLQPEGKKVMNTEAFLNGYRIEIGARLESRRKGVNTA